MKMGQDKMLGSYFNLLSYIEKMKHDVIIDFYAPELKNSKL